MHGLNQWLVGSKQQRTNGTAVITGLIWEAPYHGSYAQPSYIIKLIFIYFLTMHMQVRTMQKTTDTGSSETCEVPVLDAYGK